MSRKIFERQIVDFESGEVISILSESVRKNLETFFMGRTTEGIEWVLKFKNLTELQLLLIMLELESPKNKWIVSFHKLQVEESAEILGVAKITIRKCLTSLLENDFIVRVARGNFLVNPLTFYKGGTAELKEKYENYKKYRAILVK